MSAKSFNCVISHRGSDFVGFTPIVEDNIQLLNLQKTCECFFYVSCKLSFSLVSDGTLSQPYIRVEPVAVMAIQERTRIRYIKAESRH